VTYTYPPLNDSQYYVPPQASHTGDLDCDCNTVMYNLYMACASCQGAQIYSWTSWIAACETVYVAQLPSSIPQGTAVPHWAYFNVTTALNETYDGATMISIGRDPEEMPKSINTVASGYTTPGSTTKTSAGGLGSTGIPAVTTKSRTKTGPVIGGVVGSVVPLTIIAFVLYFYKRSRGENSKEVPQPEPQTPSPDGMDPYKQHPPSMYGPPPTVNSIPYTPYNPSDPSTFPPQSPPSSATYTTTPLQPARGAYSGIPEV